MRYRTLIVDDEEPARNLLESYAQKLDGLDIVGVVDNALKAKSIIQNEKVDILLTDIEMPDLTGIELVKILKNPPVTIFTTAYSEYALEGYELEVIDYLVKPFSFTRFCKAIDKATELLHYQKSGGQKESQNPSPSMADQQKYFFVRTNRKMVKVDFDEILFIKSFGEYVKIYTTEDVIVAMQTTNYMEGVLPKEDFIRIHRSYIINLHHVKEIEANHVVIEGERLPISKRKKEWFLEVVKRKGVV